MLVPVRLGLRRGTMHQHAQTAAGDLPDSVRLQSAALYSTSRRPMNSSIGSLLCYVPFHRLNPAETGREDAHFARTLRVSTRCRQLDSASALSWISLCSSGWHEGNGQSLRCSLLRHCASGRLPCFISQPQEPLCSLSPQHRHPLSQDPPRCLGPRRLPPAGRCGSHSDGPIE